MCDVLDRVTDYLSKGGLFNPELMEHNKVKNLILDCRDKIRTLKSELNSVKDRLYQYHYSPEQFDELQEEIKLLKYELNQQRFNNKHNLSIDQKIADELDRLKTQVEGVGFYEAAAVNEIARLKEELKAEREFVDLIAKQSINQEEFELNGGEDYESTDHRGGYEYIVADARHRQDIRQVIIE